MRSATAPHRSSALVSEICIGFMQFRVDGRLAPDIGLQPESAGISRPRSECQIIMINTPMSLT